MPTKKPNIEKEFTKEKLTEAAWFDVQCNFSAMLYLVSEQQALIGKLLEELVKAGVVKGPALNRITSIRNDHEDFGLTHSDTHKKFTNYFYAVRKILSETEPDENGDYHGPKNNKPLS